MKEKTLYKNLFLFISVILCVSCKTRIADYGPDIYKPDTTFKVVGYLGDGNFDHFDSLELNKLTYLNLAFGNPDSEGNLIMEHNTDIGQAVKKGHEAGLKVFISLAGGGRPDTTIWKSMLLPRSRSSFVKKIMDFVDKNKLDGVDVDIEWNLLPSIGETYNPFVLELRNALHAKGKGITSALGAVELHPAISQEALEAYDFINVMVYDKTGVWRPTDIGPHSPYSYAEEAIKFWTIDRKIPAGKITLGVPFYGFDFTPPARYISFREIIQQNLSDAYRDSSGMKYYNGIPTIARKTQLAKEKLGGIMIWEISYDAPEEMSLLRTLDQTLKAENCTTGTFFRDEDGDGYGNMAKPIQSCVCPVGYVSDMNDTDDTKAKVHPRPAPQTFN